MAYGDRNYRVYGEPTLFAIQVFSYAFKEFGFKNPWERKFTKAEKDILMDHFQWKSKSLPAYFNQMKPSGKTDYDFRGWPIGDNGLFKSIVLARETAWILSQKDINLNIDEFVNYSDTWKR